MALRIRLRHVQKAAHVLARLASYAACTSALTAVSCGGSSSGSSGGNDSRKVDGNKEFPPPAAAADAPDRRSNTPIPEYGPHTVKVVKFYVRGADQRQPQAARHMAEQKQRELLECYRRVPMQRYTGPGAPQYMPAGTLTLELQTEPDGTMTMRHLHPFTSEELNECVRRAFNRQPSSFPATTMIVEFRFDRPLLDMGPDAGARPSSPR